MRGLMILPLIFGLGICLPGPADGQLLSIIKGAVEAAVEDRSSGDIAKDLAIKTEFTSSVLNEMGGGDAISINLDVYEQDVMLTGSVATKAQRSLAENLVRGIADVKKVFNEIIVEKSTDKDKGTIEGAVDDKVIITKINALLLDAKGVNVTNFRYRSIGGRVFLFGRAFTKDEKAKAAKVVKEIKNVVSVKNLVKVRPKG